MPALAGAATPITRAVVYGDRAQVTRTGPADCATGQARFSGLPSTLDPKSLWASLGDGGEVVGLTREEQATGPQPEAAALQQQIRKLDEQLATLAGERAAAGAVTTKLDSFRSHMQRVWGDQATTKAPPVASWDAALDLLQREAVAARVRVRQVQSQVRQLLRQRDRLSQQLRLVERKRRRTTFVVTVHLRCKGRPQVQLSYVVPGATWRPDYRLHVGRNGRAELTVRAIVQQGTGEDWRDVRLAVSTANLQRSNLPPKIRRMRVSTHEAAETRKVLTRRFEHRRHLDAKKPPKVVTAGLLAPPKEEPALALQLDASTNADVPGDGREVAVPLEQRRVTVRIENETVPKLYPYVYRRVSLHNPFAFPLLPGTVELVEGDTFLGRTQVKQHAPGEPVAFSLGVENQLQVHRYVKREKLEGAKAFGSTKLLRHRYVIQLGNWNRSPQRVRVLENIPVAQAEQIQVSLSDDSTRPTRWNRTDGFLAWEVQLPPRSKRTITVDYTIRLPKSWAVQGYN
jgi:uncharacterized protein (TIGR02231 family)